MTDFEDKRGLAERFRKINEGLNEIKSVAENIENKNDRDKIENLVKNISAII